MLLLSIKQFKALIIPKKTPENRHFNTSIVNSWNWTYEIRFIEKGFNDLFDNLQIYKFDTEIQAEIVYICEKQKRLHRSN